MNISPLQQTLEDCRDLGQHDLLVRTQSCPALAFQFRSMVKLLRSIRERIGTNRFEFGSRPVLFQPVSHQQLLASDMFVSRIEDQLMDRLLGGVFSYLGRV